MNYQEIKDRLIANFAEVFNAEMLIDKSDPNSQAFDFQVAFEFQDSKQNWHDAYMNIESGRIYKNQEPISYQSYGDPFGREEAVGGEISIESVDYGNIECYVDSDPAPFQIKEDDLFLAIKNQNNTDA